MRDLKAQTSTFIDEKKLWAADASQIAALHLLCGIDLRRTLQAPRAELGAIIARLRRILERERLKGCRNHWSYDLNRHIALAQALDRLQKLVR